MASANNFIFEDREGNPLYVKTFLYVESTSAGDAKARALHNIDISLRRIAAALETQVTEREQVCFNPPNFVIDPIPPMTPPVPPQVKKRYEEEYPYEKSPANPPDSDESEVC